MAFNRFFFIMFYALIQPKYAGVRILKQDTPGVRTPVSDIEELPEIGAKTKPNHPPRKSRTKGKKGG